jgi:allantoicase
MKIIILFIAFMVGIGYAFAQTLKPEVIAPAGDYFTNMNYSMSWTIGECITETYSSKNNTLTQGFQQSSYTITAVNQLSMDGNSVKAFPNPTTDFITVSVETTNSSLKDCSIALFDIQGKLCMNKKLNDKSIQLDLSRFTSGTYFLKVSDQGKNMLQNFKILKK